MSAVFKLAEEADKLNPISELISDLTYRTYKYNRDTSPDITPESWKKIFGPEVESMEERYQEERFAV